MFKRLLALLAKELSIEHISYMVIGGQAVLYYGEPRLTKDIDITLGVDVDSLDKILAIGHRIDCSSLVDDPEEFTRSTMVLPMIHDKSGIRIDFIFSYSKYERQAITRGVKVMIIDTDVTFASLEDLMIHKLIAGRERDLKDLKNLFLKNPGYDDAYITRWLLEFDKALDQDFTHNFRSIIGKT